MILSLAATLERPVAWFLALALVALAAALGTGTLP